MRRRRLLTLSAAAALACPAYLAGAEEAVPDLRRLEHGWQVLSVSRSPDGRHLASGGADRTAKVWNGRTGVWDVERRAVRRSLSLGERVHALAFSQDGKTLAIGLRDKSKQSALRLLHLPGTAAGL